MIRVCTAILLCCGGMLCGASIGPRRALVLGNDSYPGNRLENARNDARSVADALARMGYVVSLLLDGNRRELAQAVDTFSNTVHAGDVTLVYYAGHGLQVQGENYLVPTDFRITDEADVPTQGYSLSKILNKLSSRGASTEVVILDACRDNPFLTTRSMRGGWADMTSSAGTFLAFGTSPGSTASDNPKDGHGLFTLALLKYMSTSPLGIEGMFQQVREEVIRMSGGHQVPWTASSLIGTLHMIPTGDETAPLIGPTQVKGDVMSFVAGRSTRGVSRDEQSMPREVGQEVDQAIMEMRGLRFTEAITILKRVISIVPNYGIALRLLGIALELGGHSDDAVQVLSRAVAADPNDALAYSYRCLCRSTNDAALAMKDCEQAMRLDESIPQAHIGLGLSLLRTGQDKLANEEFGRAIVLDGQRDAKAPE